MSKASNFLTKISTSLHIKFVGVLQIQRKNNFSRYINQIKLIILCFGTSQSHSAK